MQAIGELTDIDIAEAHQSKAMMGQIEDSLRPLQRALDFIQARRWVGKVEAAEYKQTWVDLLTNEYGEDLLESIELLSKRGIRLHGERQKRAHRVMQAALALAADIRFLHWELAYPMVWSAAGSGARSGGFDAVIGNPPWDRIKLQQVEWFAERRSDIAKAARAADRKRMIEALQKRGDPLWNDYQRAQAEAETAARVARDGGDYPLLSGGDINLYSLFVERAQSLVHPRGIVGLLTPSGIAADKGAAEFFRSIATSGRLAVLYDFENKKVFFPDIDSRFKFCALVFGGEERRFAASRCAFYLHAISDLDDAERVLALAADDFATVNPNTGAAPIFRSRRDADITTAIYRRQPVLVDRRSDPPKKAWPVRYVTMFHMTNDSQLFLRRDELEKQGWYPIGGNRWKKGEVEAVPLYEGKMVQLYDHRAADIVLHLKNVHRAAQQEAISDVEHQDPARLPNPQFFVPVAEVEKILNGSWALGFKEITAPTNFRTMIAAAMPGYGFGNKLPLLLPDETDDYPQFAALLLANLNSFVFDYVLRQKLHGQTINLFILEQLPMIRPEQFQAEIGQIRIADFIRCEVLRLSYTAHDLAPFARDLGYDGPPFRWDADDRRHRMARLDALFFHLYGIDREDAAYILDTFPIVRAQDEKAFKRYLTKDLVLAYMNAVAAGDLHTTVSV